MGEVIEEVTLQEAADRLGVHYMTAYRYVRTGRLKAEKLGGVWSVSVAELQAFASSQDSDEPRPSRREELPERLEARLIAGDENGAFGILENALASGATAEEVYIDHLGSAMAAIGQKWAEGVLTVADEHVATNTAIRVIGRLSPGVSKRGRSRGTIILAAVPFDHHALPTGMLRDLLRGRGFEVHDLGANTPVESMTDRAQLTNDLVAIGLAATHAGNDEAIAATLAGLAHLDAPVVLGGAAVQDQRHAAELGPCLYSSGPREALDLFERVHAEQRSG